MILIEQKEAAELIRQNKIQTEVSRENRAYNIGCEVAIRAVEQMKGKKIIHCKNCAYHDWDIVDGPYGLAQEIHWCNKLYDEQGENLAVLPNSFCDWGKEKGKKE